MYKHTLLIALLTATLGAQADTHVTVRTTGLNAGTTIEAAQDDSMIATAPVAGDSAMLAFSLTEPRLITLRVKGQQRPACRLMTTDGERPLVDLTSDKPTVYYSPLHAEYIARIAGERERLNLLYEAFHNAYSDKTSEAYRKAETDFFHEVKATFARVFAANKDTWWGPFAMLDLYNYITPDEENKAVWATFSPDAQSSFYGQRLADQLFPKDLTEGTYPKISFLDTKGKEQTVEKAMKGKRYFLIDFWANWCRPCRAEIPNLKAQYELYAKKSLGIVSISLDQNEAAWRKALEQEQMPWTMGLDRNGAAKAYNVQAIPAIFLVDGKTGKVLAADLRGETLAAKLKELFQ